MVHRGAASELLSGYSEMAAPFKTGFTNGSRVIPLCSGMTQLVKRKMRSRAVLIKAKDSLFAPK